MLDKKDFRILVLNDIHLQKDYKDGTKVGCGQVAGCCETRWGEPKSESDKAGYWGTRQSVCDLPDRTFLQTLKFIKEKHSVDYVVLLGDMIAHNDWELTEEIKAENNEYIMGQVKKTFWEDRTKTTLKDSDPLIIPVVGNHEGHPLNYENYDDPNGFMHKRIFAAYEQFVDKSQISDLVSKGFYTFSDAARNLKMISFDSNLNSMFNIYAVKDSTNPLNMLTHLADTLYESEQKQEKVVFLTHIPFADESSQTTLVKYLRLIFQRFKSTIACSLAAHTHNDHFVFYKDKDGSNMFAEFISPSLTTYEDINPSYRIYSMANNGEVTNYDQYTFNIDVMNVYALQQDFRFEFDLSYSLIQEYDIQTVNHWTSMEQKVKFLDELEDKIRNQEEFSKKYVQHFYTLYFAPTDYSQYTSQLEELKCLMLDQVDLTFYCLSSTAGNYPAYIGTVIFKYFFERTKWFVNGKPNPFVTKD